LQQTYGRKDIHVKTGSNVLFGVSAAELKAEEMIKLPILLTEHANWQEAVTDAVRTRARLAQLTDGERPDFLRPIILFQAESKDREVTVDVLRQHLIENEKIPVDRIAVATGSQRELDGIDLFDPACRIEHIITVEALKEGWDCSFAYVFCSAANIHSSKDVEQILGRVLRMPYARKRRQEELNRAYAHVSSPAFAEAAEQLKDRLVAMGFEEEEANAYIQPGQLHLPGNKHTSTAIRRRCSAPAPRWKPATGSPSISRRTNTLHAGRIKVPTSSGNTTIHSWENWIQPAKSSSVPGLSTGTRM